MSFLAANTSQRHQYPCRRVSEVSHGLLLCLTGVPSGGLGLGWEVVGSAAWPCSGGPAKGLAVAVLICVIQITL